MRRVFSAFILTMFSLVGYAQQYEMEFTDNDYATLYLDYPVAIPEDDNLLGVYYMYGIDGKNVLLTRIWTGFIPANTGVMVYANPGKYTFSKTDANVPALDFQNLLTGSVVDITPAEALANAGASSTSVVMTFGEAADTGFLGFYRFTGKKLKANKAFVIYDTANGGNVNSLTIKVVEDEPDAISEVNSSKSLQSWYTLQGIRLNNAPTHPGIYIHNGKSVIVK